MPRTCDFCDRLALIRVVTNRYVQKHKDGYHYSAIKESCSNSVCPECLVPKVLLRDQSAHHMVWRLFDRYSPDGFNFDRLLRESVNDVAALREQTIPQFFGFGETWPGLLWAWIKGRVCGS